MTKRILTLAGVLLILSCLMIPAAAEMPDIAGKGSITVTMACDGAAVPGGSLTLYRVAEIYASGNHFGYRYLEDFRECSVPVTDPSFSAMAEALADLVHQKGYQGDTKTISAQGRVSFTSLDTGLYLLIQESPAPGYYPAKPFLVSIPGGDDQGYVYNVDASPKVALEKDPTETEPTTEPPTEPTAPTQSETPGSPPEDSDKLPQTGQLNWPVPLLAAAGLLLFLLGWLLLRSGKKDAYET